MTRVTALNHAVLFVTDVAASVEFYARVLGMSVVAERPGAAAFMRAAGSANHHDLAVMRVPTAAPPPGSAGLYHLAWEVETVDELVEAVAELQALGSLVGMSDHGVSKSLYAKDPDGIEFEIMWRVPREAWGEAEHTAVTRPLNLAVEVERWGARREPATS